MVVEFTGRQVEITPAVRALAQRRIDKLARVLPGITHVRVILSAEKRRYRAEVTVYSPLLDLVANERAERAPAAMGLVFDTLTEQAKRGKARRRESPRRVPPRVAPVAVAAAMPTPAARAASRPAVPSRAAEPAGDGRSRVVRSRRVARALTADEAAAQARASEDGVVVFKDAATGRVNVMFRRRDGNLGLIDPEA